MTKTAPIVRRVWGIVNATSFDLTASRYDDGDPIGDPIDLPPGSNSGDACTGSDPWFLPAVQGPDCLARGHKPETCIALTAPPVPAGGTPTLQFCLGQASPYGDWAFGGFTQFNGQSAGRRSYDKSSWCRMLEPWLSNETAAKSVYLFVSGEEPSGADLRVSVTALPDRHPQLAWSRVEQHYASRKRSVRSLNRVINHTAFDLILKVQPQRGQPMTWSIPKGTELGIHEPVPETGSEHEFRYGPYMEFNAMTRGNDGTSGFTFRFAANLQKDGVWLYGGFSPHGIGNARNGPGAEHAFPLQCRIMDPWPAESPANPVFDLLLKGSSLRGTDFHPVVLPPGWSASPQRGQEDGSDGGADGGGGGGDGGDGGGGGGDDDDDDTCPAGH